jgi:hypothetical protein
MAHGRLLMSDVDERLRLDYDQTTDLVRTLTDVRFKLLAFVPTISGAAGRERAAVARRRKPLLMGNPRSPFVAIGGSHFGASVLRSARLPCGRAIASSR